MKIFIPVHRRSSPGYVLLLVLSSLALLMAVFASIMYWSSANATVTLRNNLFNQSQNAAESATENIAAYMIRDFTYANILSSNAYTGLFPPTSNGWPISYQFSNTNGNTNYAATVYIGTSSTNAITLNSQFAGLYGFQQPCTIASTATPLGQGQNLSATVCQTIDFTLIPLFQYAVFYNMDLEINPSAGMTINGRVHANGNIYATGAGSGTSLLVFSTNVDCSLQYTNHSSPNDIHNNRSGNVSFTMNVNNPVSGSDSMSLPIAGSTNNNPTNVLAILNSPPAAYATPFTGATYTNSGSIPSAYTTNGEVYLENEADLIITNPATAIVTGSVGSGGGSACTNIVVYYQNPNNTPYIARINPDVPVVTVTKGTNQTTHVAYSATNVNYIYYSFVTNVSFTDYREGKTVQAVQIDVSLLDGWQTSSLGGTNKITVSPYGVITLGGTTSNTISIMGTNATTSFISTNSSIALGGHQYNQINTTGSTSKGGASIDSIFIADGVPLKYTQLPAVRLVNGSELPPSGLTIATANPIYVKGNYNTTTNGFQTSTNLGNTSYTSPAALMGDAVTILSSGWSDTSSEEPNASGSTTINAATLEGIVLDSSRAYSGGLENFLRLQENWANYTLTYNGSIVVMFPSQFATNIWITPGTYYGAPTRSWGFDPNFTTASKLPPLTPRFHAIIRSTWATW